MGDPNSPTASWSSSAVKSPVIEALRGEEMGRNMLLLSITLSIGLAAYRGTNPSYPSLVSFLIATVSVGAASIINSLVFRDVSSMQYIVLELTRIAIMLLHLSLYLAWLPVLCFLLSVVPTAVAAARYQVPTTP